MDENVHLICEYQLFFILNEVTSVRQTLIFIYICFCSKLGIYDAIFSNAFLKWVLLFFYFSKSVIISLFRKMPGNKLCKEGKENETQKIGGSFWSNVIYNQERAIVNCRLPQCLLQLGKLVKLLITAEVNYLCFSLLFWHYSHCLSIFANRSCLCKNEQKYGTASVWSQRMWGDLKLPA